MIRGWQDVAEGFRDAEGQVCEAWRDNSGLRWAALNALKLAKQRIAEQAAGTPGFKARRFLTESTWGAED